MIPSIRTLRRLTVAVAALLLVPTLQAQRTPAAGSGARTGDYIVAIVNQELVTAAEIEQRMQRIRADAARAGGGATLPPAPALRQQVLESLIDERVQVTNARESGFKVDDAELDRALANVATQNQLTLPQLREQLRREGIDFAKFRSNVRDQILLERVREREVTSRIKITDAQVDAFLDERRAAAGLRPQLNLAQILVSVPDGASESVIAQRRARAEAVLARVRGGESFEAVATEVSEDANRAQGGILGMRSVDRLPDVFVNAVAGLQPGEITRELLRTQAGFHVLKLVARQEAGSFTVPQTHARHILLRPSPQAPVEAVVRRLAELKRAIVSGARAFDQAAREISEDTSAAQGGDLGWVSPGAFVPEFEEAMEQLPVNGISDPIVSRFGVHLVQVLERREVALDLRQQREQVRNLLREQKFEEAYAEWIRELRGRAYIEMREPPG